jgi:hypothetical protein
LILLAHDRDYFRGWLNQIANRETLPIKSSFQVLYKLHNATRIEEMYIDQESPRIRYKIFLSPEQDFQPTDLDMVSPKLPGPVDHVLQLFEGHENQDSRGLQPHPSWHPALEDEHWAFIA